jgi:hypothetical protein
LPRATLLHRCRYYTIFCAQIIVNIELILIFFISDLTGCCPHSTQSCLPLETQSVDLYFYTVSLKNTGVRNVVQEQNIDKITFTNHTKCGCKSKNGFDTSNSLFSEQEL